MKKQDSSKIGEDIFGKAISAYYHYKDETEIIVHSPDFDDDVIPVPYLFRDYKEMPPLEKEALQKCFGRVLDVGCCAGSHSLYLENERNLQIMSIDISEGAIEICKLRGLKNANTIDYFDLKNENFDTILLIMNGTGIIGKIEHLDDFFKQTKSLLKPGGQVLIDSSDLSYLFDADEDGGIWIDMQGPYYGELEYSISYKNEPSNKFDWLYLDFKNLEIAATKNGFSCKLLKKGEHFDYLAQLKLDDE